MWRSSREVWWSVERYAVYSTVVGNCGGLVGRFEDLVGKCCGLIAVLYTSEVRGGLLLGSVVI